MAHWTEAFRSNLSHRTIMYTLHPSGLWYSHITHTYAQQKSHIGANDTVAFKDYPARWRGRWWELWQLLTEHRHFWCSYKSVHQKPKAWQEKAFQFARKKTHNDTVQGWGRVIFQKTKIFLRIHATTTDERLENWWNQLEYFTLFWSAITSWSIEPNQVTDNLITQIILERRLPKMNLFHHFLQLST